VPEQRHYARLDSGAEATLIRESTATSLNYEPQAAPPTEIVFGNGESTVTDRSVDIGSFKGLLCPDNELTEDLLSVNPFLDSGYVLHMTGQDGYVMHPETGERIHIRRNGPRWLVDLEDIAALRAIPSTTRSKVLSNLLRVTANPVKIAESLREKVIRLHERMGHAATETMCDACTGSDATWQHAGLTPKQIRRVMRKEPCLICALGKQNKPPVQRASGDRLEHLKPGEIISADIIGKITPATRGGDCYFFLFTDVKTGHLHPYTCKTKTGFLDALKATLSWYKARDCQTKILRTDSERILTMGEVGEFLREQGLRSELSAPYAHHQNIVERYVQTVVKGVATLLHGQRFLKANCWDYALFHYCDCYNHSPNSKCGNRSPHDVITGQPTNLSKTFQFAFGDLVAVHIPSELREWKFDLRQDVGIFIGQPDHSVDSGLIYYPYLGKVDVRSNLRQLSISDEAYQRYYSRRYDIRDSTRTAWSELSDVAGDLTIDFTQFPTTESIAEFKLKASIAEEEEVPPELRPAERRKAVVEKSDRVLMEGEQCKGRRTSRASKSY
jgi:hypothetical protein